MFARPSSQHKSQVSLQKSGILGTLDLGLHVNRPEDSAWICCLLSIVRKLCSHKFSWITGPKKKEQKLEDGLKNVTSSTFCMWYI